MSYDFDHSMQQQGMSSGAKFAIGCGSAVFLCMIVLCGGALFFGFRLVDNAKELVDEVVKEMEKQVDTFAVPFEAQGYERVKGQVADVTSDVEKPTVYTVQVFKLNADSSASLAVMAQMAEINGTIDGDLTFFGQMLTIRPDAVVTGDLHIQAAQTVDNRGTVEGKIIDEKRLAQPTDEPPTSEDSPDEGPKPSPGDVIETTPTDETPPAEPSVDDHPPPSGQDAATEPSND